MEWGSGCGHKREGRIVRSSPHQCVRSWSPGGTPPLPLAFACRVLWAVKSVHREALWLYGAVWDVRVWPRFMDHGVTCPVESGVCSWLLKTDIQKDWWLGLRTHARTHARYVTISTTIYWCLTFHILTYFILFFSFVKLFEWPCVWRVLYKLTCLIFFIYFNKYFTFLKRFPFMPHLRYAYYIGYEAPNKAGGLSCFIHATGERPCCTFFNLWAQPAEPTL